MQQVLYGHVAGTPGEPYVAKPDPGSMHNFGMALDLSLLDEHGKEIDTGTPFDDFRPIAQPRHEDQFLTEGLLTEEQVRHRRLLRELMESAGFIQLPHEWWHYDALPKESVHGKFSIVE